MSAAGAKPRRVKPKLVVEDPTLPDLARAAHIGMIVLKHTGCNTWRVLCDSPDAQLRVVLTQHQQELIDANSHVLQYLRQSPMCSIAVCTVCGRWRLIQQAVAKGKKCNFTIGCEGILRGALRTPYRAPKAAVSNG